MSKPQPEVAPPRLPKRLSAEPLAELEEQAIYENCLLADCDLSDQSVEFVTFEGAHLKQVALQRCTLRMLRLADVRLEACDLAEAVCEAISISRAEFIGCRMIGFEATGGRVEDLLLKGCNAAHAQLWGNVFKRARFESCNLNEINFQGCDLSGAVFDRCDLRGAKFVGAKLAGADLRTAQIEGAQAGIKELQGAIVNTEQALSIVRALGVDVRLE